jgi:hypothetical protein
VSNQPGGPRQPNQPFQEQGEWRSYDDAGRLLRWDDRSQAWTPIPGAAPLPRSEAPTVVQGQQFQQPYQQPQQNPSGQGQAPYQPPYAQQPYAQQPYGAREGFSGYLPVRFASLKTPATWVYVTLGVAILASIVYLAGAAMQVSALRALQDPDSDANFFDLLEDVETADDVVVGGAVFQGLATAVCAGMFIWWLRRATCNVPALGAAGQEFTPGWAIGWWFIPFANLVQPLRVVNQAWRASDSSAIRSGDAYAWKRASVGGIVMFWWLAWIGASLAGGILNNVYDQAEDIDVLENAAMALVVVQVATIAAAVLAALVVRSLTQRHEIANQVRTTPAY